MTRQHLIGEMYDDVNGIPFIFQLDLLHACSWKFLNNGGKAVKMWIGDEMFIKMIMYQTGDSIIGE